MTDAVKCFACDRAIKGKPKVDVITEDGAQHVYVGPDCHKKIVKAGDKGYQPPTGGPRLFIIKDES